MRKKSFISSVILLSIILLTVIGVAISVVTAASTEYEGWEGLGAAVLIVAAIVLGSVLVFLLSIPSAILSLKATGSTDKRIRVTSVVLSVLSFVFLTASAVIVAIVLIGGL
jgi:hypothetical protein